MALNNYKGQMTTPKASGAKRVARKAKIEFDGWNWTISGTGTYIGPCHVITGYTGSAAKLKKLVELDAAVSRGDHDLHRKITDAIYTLSGESRVELVLEALGLTQPKARAGRRSRE